MSGDRGSIASVVIPRFPGGPTEDVDAHWPDGSDAVAESATAAADVIARRATQVARDRFIRSSRSRRLEVGGIRPAPASPRYNDHATPPRRLYHWAPPAFLCSGHPGSEVLHGPWWTRSTDLGSSNPASEQ